MPASARTSRIAPRPATRPAARPRLRRRRRLFSSQRHSLSQSRRARISRPGRAPPLAPCSARGAPKSTPARYCLSWTRSLPSSSRLAFLTSRLSLSLSHSNEWNTPLVSPARRHPARGRSTRRAPLRSTTPRSRRPSREVGRSTCCGGARGCVPILASTERAEKNERKRATPLTYDQGKIS